MGSVPRLALGEGSAQVGALQRLQSDTAIYVDIVDHTTETITWDGTGTLRVYAPGNNNVNAPDATLCVPLSSLSCLFGPDTFDPTVNGTYRVRLQNGNPGNQTGAWDITVNGADPSRGRVHSPNWHFNTGSFAESAATDASFYALVPGGASGKTGVMELKFDGMSGFDYYIGANRTGVSGVNAGRSVPVSGNGFVAAFEMYLLPPQIGTYDPVTPTVSNYTFTTDGTAQDCSYIRPGTDTGTFTFTTNVDGVYNLVCDLNDDGVYNRVASVDRLIVGLTTPGTNMVTWDGKDNVGNNVPPGDYNCKVFVSVGELHFVGQDIETSYQGLRLFGVDGTLGRSSVAMFWNDTQVQDDDVDMPAPTSVEGLESSGANGISSGTYAGAAVPNVNAHSWGNFGSTSKGNDSYIDTFGSLISVGSTVASLRAVNSTTDSDNDLISDFKEACIFGTEPDDNDSDNDGVSDTIETGTGMTLDSGTAIDTDMDGTIDALDTDSDGDGVLDGTDPARTDNTICQNLDGDGCDDCAVVHAGGGSTSNDGTDTDGDLDCNASDDDDDNDGVDDDDDGEPLDNTQCRDLDGDMCDDCAIVHTGGGSTTNDGTDTDGDTACNVGDEDDDNDGVDDDDDTNPLSSTSCADSDGDGCNDCVNVHTGGGDPSNDGLDTDGDGLCNSGDEDRDGDGVNNPGDVAPLDNMRCRDVDDDTCDDCSVVHTGGGDPDNDGADTDGDGVCNAGEMPVSQPDADGDGVPDASDKDSDNDGIPDTSEGNGDRDGDGIPDKRDLDSDNDGIPDIVEAGGVDANRDGRVDGFKDANKDGLHDAYASKPLPRPDTDDDGLRDGLDLDSDADGITDVIEAGGTAFDTDGDGRVDDTFDENDNGWDDSVDGDTKLKPKGKPLPVPDTDKDGAPDFQDVDSDDDSVGDEIEGHDFDADGVADTDIVGDGNSDGLDDAFKGKRARPDRDKDGTPDYLDADDDQDSLPTQQEVDDAESNPDLGDDPDNDGVPSYLDPDSDGDGVDDGTEATGGGDINGDGKPDYLQPNIYPKDSDGDGLPDYLERPNGMDVDSDGDGMPDYLDTDDDGDGIPTRDERPGGVSIDSDGDGAANYLDPDDDNDGVPTFDERDEAGMPMDTDSDGTPDHLDTDDDGDGLNTEDELDDAGAEHDSDGDGIPDHRDVDDDGDGVPTRDELGEGGMHLDTDGDGIPNHLDTDDDGDSIPTAVEHSKDEKDFSNDIDGDGIPNYLDLDSDGDGSPDETEAGEDFDNDGIPDYQEPPIYGYAGGALCSTLDVRGERSTWSLAFLLALGVLVIRRRGGRTGA